MREKLGFFAKCIVAALPFLLVTAFTFLAPMCYMDREYPARQYLKNVIASDTDYDVLILGDSRAMADLMPEYMGDSCVNLATGGATAIENYYYLKDYLKHHPAPEKCVILFAPFHYSYMDNFWERSVYFNELGVSQTAEVLKNAKDCGSETVLREHFASDLIANRLRFPNVYLPALINARFVGRYAENRAVLSELESSRGYAPFGTEQGSSDLNYETSYERLRESGDADLIRLYLRKTLDLCEANGIRAYVLQAPMNHASVEKLQEGFVKGYTLLMRSFSDLHPNAVVEMQIPDYDNALFGDASHLNAEGAEKFTKEVIARHFR